MYRIKRFSCLLLLAFLLPVGMAAAADSTAFNPLPVSILAKNVSVPVGTVVIWSNWNTPTDGVWLDCNGQYVGAYPDLVNAIGSWYAPNYSGMFLRGYGGQTFNSGGFGDVWHSSGNLGQIQGDAARRLWGMVAAHGVSFDDASGVFGLNSNKYGQWLGTNADGGHVFEMASDDFGFDNAAVMPTAAEGRPVNMAVRYLIKAK